jgi:hypothetical protein
MLKDSRLSTVIHGFFNNLSTIFGHKITVKLRQKKGSSRHKNGSQQQQKVPVLNIFDAPYYYYIIYKSSRK